MGYDRQRCGVVRVLIAVGVVALGLTVVPFAASAQSFKPSASMSVRGDVSPHRVAGPAVGASASAAAPQAVSATPDKQDSIASPATSSAGHARANAAVNAHQASNAPGKIREASLGPGAGAAAAIKPVLKGLGPGGIKAAAKKLNPAMARALKEFEVAKDAFAGFCQQWHKRLVDRQINNASHIDWKLQNGIETGTYVSYGPIETCVCKQAENGIPIGELTYNELDYTVTGKTKGQARHAKPSVSVVPTREIFSWSKGKWFY